MVNEWEVIFHKEFEDEYDRLSECVQDKLLAFLVILEKLGPRLNRPHIDTLKGSHFKNMKELRFDADNGSLESGFSI